MGRNREEIRKKIDWICICKEKVVILCEEIKNNNINQQLFRAKQHIARQGNKNLTMMIRIRKATVEDVAYIAEGIYYAFLLDWQEETTSEALITSEKGAGDKNVFYNQWIRTLKDVCAQEDTHYSYRNTWIAEVDGERAGMMIAVNGEHYRVQRDRMYPQLKGLFLFPNWRLLTRGCLMWLLAKDGMIWKMKQRQESSILTVCRCPYPIGIKAWERL